MNIEKGELFVVSRGVALAPLCALDPFDFGGKPEAVQHDRSFEGIVFRAAEVCGPHIAAVCAYNQRTGSWSIKPGDTESINTREVEVWPVTQAYLDALTGAKA